MPKAKGWVARAREALVGSDERAEENARTGGRWDVSHGSFSALGACAVWR